MSVCACSSATATLKTSAWILQSLKHGWHSGRGIVAHVLGLSGGFKLRDEAAKLFFRLVKVNAGEKCLCVGCDHQLPPYKD